MSNSSQFKKINNHRYNMPNMTNQEINKEVNLSLINDNKDEKTNQVKVSSNALIKSGCKIACDVKKASHTNNIKFSSMAVGCNIACTKVNGIDTSVDSLNVVGRKTACTNYNEENDVNNDTNSLMVVGCNIPYTKINGFENQTESLTVVGCKNACTNGNGVDDFSDSSITAYNDIACTIDHNIGVINVNRIDSPIENFK